MCSCNKGNKNLCDKYLDRANLKFFEDYGNLSNEYNFDLELKKIGQLLKTDSANYIAHSYYGNFLHYKCIPNCNVSNLKEIQKFYENGLLICSENRYLNFNMINILNELYYLGVDQDDLLSKYLSYYNEHYVQHEQILSTEGQLEYRKKNYIKSIQLLELSDSLNKDCFKKCFIAMNYIELKKIEKAKNILIEAIELDSVSGFAYENMGIVYYYLGDLLNAKYNLKKALEINSMRYHSYNWLGYIELKNQNFEEACRYLNKSFEIRPKNNTRSAIINRDKACNGS